MADEPALIQDPNYLDNNNVAPLLVRRRVNGATTVSAGAVLCGLCCCIVFFLILALAVGFIFTLGSGGFVPTPTPTSTPTPTPIPVAQLQCGGFADLIEELQPTVGSDTCVPGVTGTCIAPQSCGGRFFPTGSVSTSANSTPVVCVVSAATCTAANPAVQCECPGVATCQRDVFGSTGVASFQCSERVECPFYVDVPLTQQPVDPLANCSLGTAIAGTCQLSSGRTCIVTVETVGARLGDGVPPTPQLCAGINNCTAIGQACQCAVPLCMRTVVGQTAPTSFLCAPESQV